MRADERLEAMEVVVENSKDGGGLNPEESGRNVKLSSHVRNPGKEQSVDYARERSAIGCCRGSYSGDGAGPADFDLDQVGVAVVGGRIEPLVVAVGEGDEGDGSGRRRRRREHFPVAGDRGGEGDISAAVSGETLR